MSEPTPEQLAKAQEDILSICEEMLDTTAGYSTNDFNDAFILIAKQAMHVFYLLGILDAFIEDNAGIHKENTSEKQEALCKQLLFIIRRILDKEIELGYKYGPQIK